MKFVVKNIAADKPNPNAPRKIMKRHLLTTMTVCLLLATFAGQAQTHWNAYSNFYLSPTAAGWVGATNPSAAGAAWGYYDANCNGYGSPTNIGTYFTPSSSGNGSQNLYQFSSVAPIGAGTVVGTPLWDATGGAGFPRYQDSYGWGSSLGRYDTPWFSAAPAITNAIWMQAGYLSNPSAEGICPVVTWTAPYSGTYTFNGSFVVGNNGGTSCSIAIVDSLGGLPLPRTVVAQPSTNLFSFQKTLSAGDVVQFQVGTAVETGAAVGFNCDIQLVELSGWNAYRDFYLSPTAAGWGGATNPSAAGAAWGYYDANCNGYGFPTQIGAYFTPQFSGSGSQTIYQFSSVAPIGAGTVVGTPLWDATGGAGFPRYQDSYGWGSSLGRYDTPWFSAAPAVTNAIWMQAGYLSNPSAEGICPVVTWTAPNSGTYTFNGSFVVGNNGGTNCSIAIVDSLGGIPLPRAVVAQPSTNSFGFLKTLSAGNVVQFQVGTALEIGAAVGFNCVVTRSNTPAVLVSAARSRTNPQQVIVQFFEALYAPTANNPANYSINNGVTVTGAQLNPTNATQVILTVSAMNYPSVLTVNNVANDFGHLPVAPNSTATISVPIYVPNGIGIATSGAQDTFSGSSLDSKWQSATVNYNPTPDSSNYFFSQVFTVSGGALHCHASTNTAATGGDLNYLIYVDPAYQSATTEEVLMHFKILASSFSSFSLAGAGVCMDANPVTATPPGAACLRTVPAGYAGLTNGYPFFLACSDFIADDTSATSALAWQVGGSYWLRIRQDDAMNGGIIKTKVWLGDGSQPEPASWQNVWQDPGGVTRAGYAGIRAGYSGVVMDFDVDYFLVTAAGLPTVTPTLPSSMMPQIDLALAVNGTNVIVSWPAAVGTSYKLQSTGALPSGWANIGTALVVQGDRNTVTLPLSGQKQFFRLSQ